MRSSIINTLIFCVFRLSQSQAQISPGKLTQAHADLEGIRNCTKCHTLEDLFQDRPGIRTNNCTTCHDDVHDNKFGTNCAECHNERSFSNVDTNEFNHVLTDFALRGKHQTVDCRKCHKPQEVNGETIIQYKFNSFECIDCHQ